jgi:hypothetical protein
VSIYKQLLTLLVSLSRLRCSCCSCGPLIGDSEPLQPWCSACRAPRPRRQQPRCEHPLVESCICPYLQGIVTTLQVFMQRVAPPLRLLRAAPRFQSAKATESSKPIEFSKTLAAKSTIYDAICAPVKSNVASRVVLVSGVVLTAAIIFNILTGDKDVTGLSQSLFKRPNIETSQTDGSSKQ